jgi:hypothetical protein
MLRPLLVAAACLFCGCGTLVNLSPVSAPADALRPQRADLVEVFSHTNAPDRPYSKYVTLETKSSGAASQDAAHLRAKGGAAGCDAILLRATPGQADCILYSGGKLQGPSTSPVDGTAPTEEAP